MDFKINNLGIVKEANLKIKNLTIITGENNSGKTYIAQACYGLIKKIRSSFFIKLHNEHLSKLYAERKVNIPLTDYEKEIYNSYKEITSRYTKELNNIFGSIGNNFINTKISMTFVFPNLTNNLISSSTYANNINRFNLTIIDNSNLSFSILNQNIDNNSILLADDINTAFSLLLTNFLFPSIEYSCSERNGLLLFQKDIDGNRSELINRMQATSNLDNIKTYLNKNTGKLPLCMQDNLSRIRTIKSFETNTNKFSIEQSIADKIKEINSGYYSTSNGQVFFTPNNKEKIRLNLEESSSSVCSLFDLNLVLQNIPYKTLIFIDEPEMNLHPKKQRDIARLLVTMVNLGYKLVISTHSDIIIREINTMILLNNPNKKHILEEEGYSELETLDVVKVNCYTTKANNDNTYSLEKIQVSQEEGIAIESFDNTIEEINRIQDRLLWE